MEDYVVTRELAQKLFYAGYPQNTLRFWERYKDVDGEWKIHLATGKAWETSEYNAAPLSDELLEQCYEVGSIEFIHQSSGEWLLLWNDRDMNEMTMFADKPADALAELWLWCKENGYIK